MVKLRFLLIALITIFICAQLQAQVTEKIISGEKTEYVPGDRFTIQFQLVVDPQSCQDGMEKTGIYASGISIENRSEWTELKKGLWQIVLKGRIVGNKKGMGQVTVVRKTDKQDLFKQVKFKIRKDVD